MDSQPFITINRRGDKYWKLNGKYHREGGPAIESADGYKEWYIHGKLHRVDGPAIEYRDGRQSWYLDDKRYPTKDEWFQNLTSEQQYNYLWKLK
jgi:hypothetical protein